MPRIICLFVFLLIGRLCIAADAKPVEKTAVLRMDTSMVTERHLDTAALNAYKKLPEFEYRDNYSGPSLWERFWRWFWSIFKIEDEQTASLVGQFFRYLLIGGGIAAIVFLILKLNGINILNNFRRKPHTVVPYSESVENIHEIDFDTEIEKAIAVHNYRYAVRLLYLKSLKQLSDSGLINWQINKTNSQYISELADSTRRNEFTQLTRQFEYVWYGDFTINGEVFKRISTLFSDFKGSAA
jgi:hypothetical protein